MRSVSKEAGTDSGDFSFFIPFAMKNIIAPMPTGQASTVRRSQELQAAPPARSDVVKHRREPGPDDDVQAKSCEYDRDGVAPNPFAGPETIGREPMSRPARHQRPSSAKKTRSVVASPVTPIVAKSGA